MDVHPVLQRLLARKGLSSGPAGDDRKIVLVLFGGIMVAARGAAGLLAFEEMGLTGSFDEVYTMSSGFGNACYFLSGQMRTGASTYYREFSGLKFLNVLRPWKLADLEYLLKVVRELRPLDVDKLYQSRTKLYTMVTKFPDLNAGVFLELRDVEKTHYFDLLRACSSLPVVAKGFVHLNGQDYRDVFYDEALKDFMQKVLSVDATDVVILYNYEWQRSYVRSVVDLDFDHVYEFTPKFFSGRKEWFQKLTRFETRSRVLKKQAQQFGNEVKRAFGYDEPVGLM
jgi:predicted patatin/cPLA2 family phospholipase